MGKGKNRWLFLGGMFFLTLVIAWAGISWLLQLISFFWIVIFLLTVRETVRQFRIWETLKAQTLIISALSIIAVLFMLLIIYKPFALGKIMFWLVLGSIGGIVWGFMSYKEARESIFTDRGTWLGFLVWSILVAIIQFFTLIRGVSFEPLISLLSLLTGIIGLQYLTRAIRYLNLARKEGEL